MKNWVQKGSTIEIVAPEDILSGQPVQVGNIVGIAVTSVKAGDVVALQTEGVISLPITAGTAIAQGTQVFWDAANNVVTTQGGSNPQLGYTWEAADATAASVNVKLWAA